MIRDPSDGSVKRDPNEETAEQWSVRWRAAKSKYGPNWGLKSLDQSERKLKLAPTKEELAEHYAKFNLGFEAKEKAE